MPQESTNLVHQLLSDREFLEGVRRDIQILLRVKGANRIDLDDLVQEVVVRALRSSASFNGSSRLELRNWLRAIAANRLTDELRRRWPTSGMELDAWVEQVNERTERETLDANENVQKILAGLSPFEVALLRARYKAGFSFTMIGRLLGISPDRVRQTHHRLLKRLRDQLREN